MSQAKAIIALILFAFIAGGAWFIKHQADEIGALTGTIEQQSATIKKYQKQQDLSVKSSQIDDQTVVATIKTNQAIVEKTRVIDDHTQQKEDQIRRKYDKLLAEAKTQPPVNTNEGSAVSVEQTVLLLQNERSQEISANRLDGAWEEYCQDESHVGCPVTPVVSPSPAT